MKKFFVLVMLLMTASAMANAMTPTVIGVIRDGVAVGFLAEDQVGRNFGIRMCCEANTGRQPFIAMLGGKFYLTSLGKRPYLSFGLGVVGYGGYNKTSVGVAISFIINRAFDVTPLFAELGVDVVDSPRLQAQMGYKLF